MAAEPGPGVDAAGRPVIDPTQNVLDLVQAAIQRQDDLRAAESKHIREILAMRAEHTQELRKAETARIDAIRAVDVSAVQRAAEVAAAQAEALRNQVQAASTAANATLAAALEPIQKDIADLRKTQYEQAGQRAQVGESRLNVGAILGGLSLILVLAGLVTTIIVATTR